MDNISKLPLIVLPAPADENMPLVMSITGDGGRLGFDKRLTDQFVQGKAPVVILNSFRFFRKQKTPEQAASAVEDLLDYYMKVWRKRSFILEGYSFGADVMPFVVNRLPKDLLQHCAGVALFSPGTSNDLKIHFIQMIGIHHKWKYNVVNEIKEMKAIDLKTLFFFGEKEHRFPVNILTAPHWQLTLLKGGHTYKKETRDVGQMVLEKLGLQ